MKKIFSFMFALFICLFILGFGASSSQITLTDIDGNTYRIIEIGHQVWMAENFRAVRDPEGLPITSYCYEGKKEHCKEYGRLYPWEAALKACPKGWHLPSRKEVQILFDHFGGETVAGGKLKAGGSSGFEALLAGGRAYKGTFDSLGIYGSFWVSDEESDLKAWHFGVNVRNSQTDWFPGYKEGSVSVRYIKN